MRITTHCKHIALLELFAARRLEVGGQLPFYELQRIWDLTGLRRNDLEDALGAAVLAGDLAETYTSAGRTAVLLRPLAAADPPHRVSQMQEQAEATAALRWARSRRRSGRRLGRRLDDPRIIH